MARGQIEGLGTSPRFTAKDSQGQVLAATAPERAGAADSRLAAEAIEFFVYRAVREIGSLTAALGGLDALIFTAGIGENSPVIRQRICAGLVWLGIRIDPDANECGQRCISPANASPAVWVIPTDEERVIAEHTLAIQARS